MSTQIKMKDVERLAVEQEVIAFYKEMFDAFMALSFYLEDVLQNKEELF